MKEKYYLEHHFLLAFKYLVKSLPTPQLLLNILINFCLKNAKIFENHLNPAILVFIGYLLLSTLRFVPTCPGFSHFSVFLHHFVLATLATSSVSVYCDPVFYTRDDEWTLMKKNVVRPAVRYGAAGGIYNGGSRFYVGMGFANRRYADIYSYDVNSKSWYMGRSP